MARLALLSAGLLFAAVATVPAQSIDDADLREALKEALAPALPFPAARPDGTPETGGADAVWTVRWAPPDEPRVEVLANPLNDENRRRALAAEQAIQKAAMQAQRRSQADYEQALSDFQRTGRTSEIREISLRDDGVAGERYDAESQLTVSAERIDTPRTLAVAGGSRPEAVAVAPDASAVLRVPASTYLEEGPDGVPGALRYAPEQAWILVGGLAADPPSGPDAASPDVTVSPVDRRGGVLVWIRGNAELVEQIVTRGAWIRLRALFGG